MYVYVCIYATVKKYTDDGDDDDDDDDKCTSGNSSTMPKPRRWIASEPLLQPQWQTPKSLTRTQQPLARP